MFFSIEFRLCLHLVFILLSPLVNTRAKIFEGNFNLVYMRLEFALEKYSDAISVKQTNAAVIGDCHHFGVLSFPYSKVLLAIMILFATRIPIPIK